MPGGLVDRSNYSAVTRRNGADTGKMLFGLGVVQGEEPGTDIALPATGATASKFEGVTMYSANVEMDDEGKVKLPRAAFWMFCRLARSMCRLRMMPTLPTARPFT